MMVSTGSARHARLAPSAVTSRSPGEQTRQSQGASRQHSIMLVQMAAAAGLLRDRRFQERVATLVIAMAAVSGLARTGLATSGARLAAWDRRRK